MKSRYLAKEISWLSFNYRVLQEADNETIPLVERLRFLGIYSNNLDEFFRVRVASLKRLAVIGKKVKGLLGEDPKEILKIIHEIILQQRTKFNNVYFSLIDELQKENIYILNEKELNNEQELFISEYFHNKVKHKIMPLMLDQVDVFPKIKDETIYLAVSINSKNDLETEYCLIEIPSDTLPRFIELPAEERKSFIYLDDIIRFNLNEIFECYDKKDDCAYTIKLTRDAELDIHDDISESYLINVTKSLKKRKIGSPVRLIYDKKIPLEILKIILKKLKVGKEDVLIAGGRYHNFKDFIKFPLYDTKLQFQKLKPIIQKDIHNKKDIFSVISKQDIFLYYPYHSFDYFIDFLRNSSIDKRVKEIKITLYRLATNSCVINALLNALRNGKSVIVLLEIQARFDEEANIKWANQLSDEGAKVIYGVAGLKVHSKICQVTRLENKKKQYYTCVSTGNFNEETAKVYTDAMLFTVHNGINIEISNVFSFFNFNYKISKFKHLMVSPFNFREDLCKLINQEIKNAKEGKEAFIKFKINNLSDEKVIDLLYKASNNDVKVNLLVRGMFSMVTGIKGVSDKIEARGVVDRFLEHSRVFIFCNGGDAKVFISSADLLTRNIDRRIEVTCPVYDENIKETLIELFNLQWNDNTKARVLDNGLTNIFYKNQKPEFNSQLEIHKYLKSKFSKYCMN